MARKGAAKRQIVRGRAAPDKTSPPTKGRASLPSAVPDADPPPGEARKRQTRKPDSQGKTPQVGEPTDGKAKETKLAEATTVQDQPAASSKQDKTRASHPAKAR